jgi:hypothetical protein
MTDEERDVKIIEMHQDIKWIKEWITDQNKYKIMVWAALIAALMSLVIG